MNALRSIPAYAEALTALMPRGRAWPEAGGAVWRQLMRALAIEPRRADARLLKLLDEADPRTCAETLEDWERVLGLPDPCSPGDATFTERRDAVIAKLRSIGGASPAYFIQLAADLGYEITIREHRPFQLGLSTCGHQVEPAELGAHSIRFFWIVEMTRNRLRWFSVGYGGSQTGVDPHLAITRATELACIFGRLKPAHTTVIFDYSAIEEGEAA